MFSGIQSALSGLQAYSLRTQATANNIANVNTEGFKKDKVTLSAQLPQGVSATASKVTTPGDMAPIETSEGESMVELSNVDLGQEIPALLTDKTSFNANIKSVQTADQMMQSLLDIKA
jgi:flagellar hook protein FlgE